MSKVRTILETAIMCRPPCSISSEIPKRYIES